MKIKIRPETKKDLAKIRKINTAAFDTEAEANIVDNLRKISTPVISLVAEVNGKVVGHILFSPVALSAIQPDVKIAGLAPMAVLPEFQNQGIGTDLVKQGLKRCTANGYNAAVVLGHLDFYPRFGFEPAARFGIKCEYDVPHEAFMIKELKKSGLAGCKGTVQYHRLFRNH
jgi:putative acetyltransferase